MIKAKISCYDSEEELKRIYRILAETKSRIKKTKFCSQYIKIHFYTQDYFHLNTLIKRASNEMEYGIIVLKSRYINREFREEKAKFLTAWKVLYSIDTNDGLQCRVCIIDATRKERALEIFNEKIKQPIKNR